MKKNNLKTKVISLSVIVSFLCSAILPNACFAAEAFGLPAPKEFVNLSLAYSFPVLKGLKFDPANPLTMEFIIDNGNVKKVTEQEAVRLVRYFLAGLTIPQDDLWVNLSPYEKNRIIPDKLSQTDLGEGLLSQDYILKQISASLTYPESEIGKDFWSKSYEAIMKIAKTTNIPVNTFNKIWIVPNKAEVYENENAAFVTQASLKAMLEEDYLSLNNNLAKIQKEIPKRNTRDAIRNTRDLIQDINKASSNVMREQILPKINADINKGRNFATLRQIYHSIILAVWFKEKFKKSIYQHYINKGAINGIDLSDKNAKEKVYNLYLEAFQKGLYNYIKPEQELATKKQIKRRYYSGGSVFTSSALTLKKTSAPPSSGTLINTKNTKLIVNFASPDNNSETLIKSNNSYEKGTITGSPVELRVKELTYGNTVRVKLCVRQGPSLYPLSDKIVEIAKKRLGELFTETQENRSKLYGRITRDRGELETTLSVYTLSKDIFLKNRSLIRTIMSGLISTCRTELEKEAVAGSSAALGDKTMKGLKSMEKPVIGSVERTKEITRWGSETGNLKPEFNFEDYIICRNKYIVSHFGEFTEETTKALTDLGWNFSYPTVINDLHELANDERKMLIKLGEDMYGLPIQKVKDIDLAIKKNYSRGITDEFMPALKLTGEEGDIKKNDSLVFFNFRSDRMEEINNVFQAGFDKFPTKNDLNLRIVDMTEYDKRLGFPVAFPPRQVEMPFDELANKLGILIIKVTETTKGKKHLTFFLRGKRQDPFPNEKLYVNFPSPKKANPEMMMKDIANKIKEVLGRIKEKGIGEYKKVVIIGNLCAPDMVGHEGNFELTKQAVEATDRYSKEIIEAVLNAGGAAIDTADHGNAEENTTSHTIYPVHCVFAGKGLSKKTGLRDIEQPNLSNIYATIFHLLGNLKDVPKSKSPSLLGDNFQGAFDLVYLNIRDGQGINPNPNDPKDAVRLAEKPFYDSLKKEYPYIEIGAAGEDAGVREGQMGNSEVGHETIGAGVVSVQDILEIDRAIKDGSFYQNKALLSAMDSCLKNNSALHLSGLAQDAAGDYISGVHSSLQHLRALLQFAKNKGVKRVYLHLYLDGRDEPPTNGIKRIQEVKKMVEEIGVGKIVEVIGRFYVMDREDQWERVQIAYDSMVGSVSLPTTANGGISLKNVNVSGSPLSKPITMSLPQGLDPAEFFKQGVVVKVVGMSGIEGEKDLRAELGIS